MFVYLKNRIPFLLTGFLLMGLLGFTLPQPIFGEEQTPVFQSAKPVWPEGLEKEKNIFAGFRAQFEKPDNGKAILRIAGSTLYRIYLNGQFVGYGPARGPQGYFRVDEWALDSFLAKTNVLAVESAGYNVNSYALLDQPSFVQAEVCSEGRVLASTGGDGKNFVAFRLPFRLQKVQRYSFQRPFSEYYRMKKNDAHWWSEEGNAESSSITPVNWEVVSEKKLLPRRVAYPRFNQRQPSMIYSTGSLKQNVPVEKPWKDRSLTQIGPKLGGFLENELEVIPSLELQQIQSIAPNVIQKSYAPQDDLSLGENEFAILDLNQNQTGFIGFHLHCTKPVKIDVTFDEILRDGDVDFKRLGCVNAVCYELQPGDYDLESFEPYTLRYLKFNVLQGDCQIHSAYLREYANDETGEAYFACSDMQLNRVFEAARETFRQNAVDIFMDCPSRERAGWLCDSFFTSRVAFDLCGNTTIEKNFMENFCLPDSFEYLPKGMLPMCYPADHNDGVFIPNWSLWFVVELEEYLQRSGDQELVNALKPKLKALYDYFKPFRNEDGLLEKLQSWVFVEWSKANEFVQDVNYPTNMLYAAALAAGGRMYHDPGLITEAERIRETIRKQSYDGEFFVDNAVRNSGKLESTGNHTEVCQYFAFFFDVANPGKYPELWKKLQSQFGPKRKETKAFPEIYPANAFVGNYLRLELLSRYGLADQLKNELVDYYLYMADQTGTLWENDGAYASCDHGFASHVAHVFYRDVLGIAQIDTQKKTIQLRFNPVSLDWCEGTIPTPDGPLSVRWWKTNGNLDYRASVPGGYTVKVDNRVKP